MALSYEHWHEILDSIAFEEELSSMESVSQSVS
jgi:hypothetical protein